MGSANRSEISADGVAVHRHALRACLLPAPCLQASAGRRDLPHTPSGSVGLAVTDEGVEASVVAGTRTVPFEQIEGARVVEGRLALRPGGLSASGYHTGAFHLDGEGRVQAYASTLAGRFALLERAGEDPIVVSPADPEAFVEAVEARRR